MNWYAVVFYASDIRTRGTTEFESVGTCLECFGFGNGTVYQVNLNRAPRIGDFALLEAWKPHPVTGLRLSIKKLGIRARRSVAGGAHEDVVTCESITPPYSLFDTDQRVRGTVVAAFVPYTSLMTPMAEKVDAYLDSLITQVNSIHPRLNWHRPAALRING